MKRSVHFQEDTAFSPRLKRWLMAAIALGQLIVIGVFGYGLVQQILLGRPFGNPPMSDAQLIVLALILLVLMLGSGAMVYLIIVKARCRLTVHDDRMVIDAVPFGSRTVRWREVRSWKMTPTRHIGMNYGLRRGWTINLAGRHLLVLDLKRNGRVAVGTARPDELAAAVTATLGPPGSAPGA